MTRLAPTALRSPVSPDRFRADSSSAPGFRAARIAGRFVPGKRKRARRLCGRECLHGISRGPVRLARQNVRNRQAENNACGPPCHGTGKELTMRRVRNKRIPNKMAPNRQPAACALAAVVASLVLCCSCVPNRSFRPQQSVYQYHFPNDHRFFRNGCAGLAFIEFDDKGSLFHPEQVDHALDLVHQFQDLDREFNGKDGRA